MQLCPYCGRYRNVKGANGYWGCGACEAGRAHNVGNSMNVDKQASQDLIFMILEIIVFPILGLLWRLVVIVFRLIFRGLSFLFKGLMPASMKSRKFAAKPSFKNPEYRVVTDYEQSQHQRYENDEESKERALKHAHDALENAKRY